MKKRKIYVINFMVMALLIFFLSSCGDSGIYLVGSTPKGTIYQTTSKIVMDDCSISYDIKGEIINGTVSTCAEIVENTEKVSDNEIRFIYHKNIQETRTTLLGETKSQIEKNCLQGLYIIGKKNNEKWTYTLESGQPTKEQQKKLTEMADSTDVYPNHKIKIGEEWEMSEEAIKSITGSACLRSSGKAKMKLKEIIKYKGEKCALLSFNIQIVATILDDENNEMTMKIGMQGEIYRNLNIFNDVMVEAKGQTIVLSEIIEEGNRIKYRVAGPMKITSQTVIE